MKILNLYAGLGGNRKLWEGHEVTAVEYDEEVAELYKQNFPQDTVIVGDAHQFLLDNYNGFDFIWSSPPCPTHSRPRMWASKGGRYPVKYPDMKLYEEIILLQNFRTNPWWCENVKPYYKPLIPVTKTIGRHSGWGNFDVPDFTEADNHTQTWSVTSTTEKYGFSVADAKIKHRKDQLIRNLVNPAIGLHILNSVPPNLTTLLQSIPGDSLFAEAIRTEAATNLSGVVQMIKDQIKDGHRVLVVDIVGERVVTMIEEIKN